MNDRNAAVCILLCLTVLIGSAVFLDAQRSQQIVDDFHKLYYQSSGQTWLNTRWLGVPIQKCPLDLQVFQEIIWETRPDVIVEAGTAFGGSALFMADVLDAVGKGRVVTIDIKDIKGRPQHGRITYLTGSSTSPAIVAKVKSMIRPGETVMVDLDSDHRKAHVLKEMRLYAPLVTKGSYLIVEDTNINGHPVEPNFGPGPAEALAEFLKGNRDFVVDKQREKLILTFNPGGYLRKVR